MGHPSPRRRARRQRKKPDWGNSGHGAYKARAGRAPASPRGPDRGTGKGARASTCGCRPDSARRLGSVASNWLHRSRILLAFLLAFSQKQNSSALLAENAQRFNFKLSSTALLIDEVVSRRSSVVGRGSWVMGRVSWIVGRVPWVVGHGSWVVDLAWSW